jgi:hypothetical protein
MFLKPIYGRIRVDRKGDLTMAFKRNKLLDDLLRLREELRLKHTTDIKVPSICSDDALLEMSKEHPLKESDFLAIQGLDSNFIEVYAMDFLSIIKKHNSESAKTVKLSKEAFKVLDHYKDRLSNISRTNPNLYMGRIDQIRSFDLAFEEVKEELYHFVSSKKNQLTLPLKASEYKHLVVLHRELLKDFKETGGYHLYVAYPYVTGIFKKDNFTIKAPLCYIPVTLTRNKQTFTIDRDLSKDITLNRDLLLAASKIAKNQVDFDMPFIDNISKKTLSEIILPFYNTHGIELKIDDFNPFMPFVNERKESFFKRKKGIFEVMPYVTLGRYHLYSSMIQKDMAQILNDKKYNDLLEGLIDEKNLDAPEKPTDTTLSKKDINEKNITYINPLNFSQEKVIELINSEKKMVIWGPPGTGKSQVITSLIASSVLKGENVLVVSEKKVALEVIYNRLEEAKKYTMFLDDVSNKQPFYEKLSHMIDHNPPKRTKNNDTYKLEEQIDQLNETFNQSIRLLYQDKLGHKEVYHFYERYLKDKDINLALTPKIVLELFKEGLKKPTFLELDQIEQTFDKDSKLKEYIDYHRYLIKYPWFLTLETKISRSSKMEFNDLYQTILSYHEEKVGSRYFKKRRLKRAFIKENQTKLSYLTNKKNQDKKLIKAFESDLGFVTYVKEMMNKLNKLRTVYLGFNKKEVRFLHLFVADSRLKALSDTHKLRTYLFDAYYTGYLENLKALNQKYLYIFDDYEKRINELRVLIEEKRQVSLESFVMSLYQNALKLSNTKRIMDIKRILEADKKPSMKAFFDVFHLELTSNIKVWLLTPEVVSALLPLQTGLFDLVIFDEASQLYVERGIPAIYRAKKVVIAGDPKQLRPSSLGVGRIEEDDDLDDGELLKDITIDAKSLLDLARYRYKETLLNYHYRSKYEELILFSNHAFYDSKLIVSPNVETPKKPPIEYVYAKDGSFINKRNPIEAKEVITLLKKILKEKDPEETIGIITFNSTQRDVISDLIDEELFKGNGYQKLLEKEVYRKSDQEDQSLFVKNIENVQGDERDIIIFSMGYAKDDKGVVKRRFGWLNHEGGQNRLNVAITRAKKKIYFVSSLYPEELKVDDLSGKGPKLLKDFMRYCYYISTGKKELAKEVLLQLSSSESSTKVVIEKRMTEEIKARVEKLGYIVEHDLGIGQFKLDLAIKDPVENKYVLGVICDLDENPSNARLSLLHHEKFLESRGWQTVRIFHSNWYEDQNKELKRIKDKLKSI